MHPSPGPDSTEEFLSDGSCDEPSQGERGHGIEIPQSQGEECSQSYQTTHKRSYELPPEVGRRGLAPGDQRADSGETQQQESEGDIHPIKEGRSDSNLGTTHQL